MVEHFEVQCPYCLLPVTVAWETGDEKGRCGVLPGPYALVAACVYHETCWDKLVAEHPP